MHSLEISVHYIRKLVAHTHIHTYTHTQGKKGASLPSAEDLQYDVVATAPRYTPSQKEKEEGKGKRKRQK